MVYLVAQMADPLEPSMADLTVYLKEMKQAERMVERSAWMEQMWVK